MNLACSQKSIFSCTFINKMSITYQEELREAISSKTPNRCSSEVLNYISNRLDSLQKSTQQGPDEILKKIQDICQENIDKYGGKRKMRNNYIQNEISNSDIENPENLLKKHHHVIQNIYDTIEDSLNLAYEELGLDRSKTSIKQFIPVPYEIDPSPVPKADNIVPERMSTLNSSYELNDTVNGEEEDLYIEESPQVSYFRH